MEAKEVPVVVRVDQAGFPGAAHDLLRVVEELVPGGQRLFREWHFYIEPTSCWNLELWEANEYGTERRQSD